MTQKPVQPVGPALRAGLGNVAFSVLPAARWQTNVPPPTTLLEWRQRGACIAIFLDCRGNNSSVGEDKVTVIVIRQILGRLVRPAERDRPTRSIKFVTLILAHW